MTQRIGNGQVPHTATKGFKQSGQLLRKSIKAVAQKRGFSETELLTQWPEIAGETLASMSRPTEVRFDRHGLGATLTVLTTGAQAPLLEMQKEKLRQKVNAIYGYNAIAKIRITQTAPTGFSEGQADFQHRKTAKAPPPSAQATKMANELSKDVANDELRSALTALGQNLLTKTKKV